MEIVVTGQMMVARYGGGHTGVRSVRQAQGVGRRRGPGVPGPAAGLAIEHSQLVVD